jgi:hypothetical protein
MTMNDDVFVVVKYDYTAQEEQELTIRKNDRLRLLDDTKNWWKVRTGLYRLAWARYEFRRTSGTMFVLCNIECLRPLGFYLGRGEFCS